MHSRRHLAGVALAVLSAVGAACSPSTERIGVQSSSSTSSDGGGSNDTTTTADGPTSTSAIASSSGAADDAETTTGSTSTGVPADDTSADCLLWPSGSPSAPPQASAILASTPLGDFDLGYAFFSAYGTCDECVVESVGDLFFSADPASAEMSWSGESDGLRLSLSHDGGFEGPVGEPSDGELWAFRDGEGVNVLGVTFVLDAIPQVDDLAEPYDAAAPPLITGNLMIEAPDWSVQGTFTAFYTPDHNGFPVCE
jgi:hypothetical protein